MLPHSPRASPKMPRSISPAIVPKGRGRWPSGRRQAWDALLGWAGGATMSISRSPAASSSAAAASDDRTLGSRSRRARSVPPGRAVAGGDDRRVAGRGAGVLEGRRVSEQAWQAVSVDERWQLEKWGSDAEAEAALENCRRDSWPRRFLENAGQLVWGPDRGRRHQRLSAALQALRGDDRPDLARHRRCRRRPGHTHIRAGG